MKNNQLNNLVILIVFLVLVFTSITNNMEVRRVSNKLTTGWVNTVLILLILGLSITEDLQIGLLISVLYLVAVVRFNSGSNENFISGPSPLNCSTYGDSKKRTGTAFYPLHASN